MVSLTFALSPNLTILIQQQMLNFIRSFESPLKCKLENQQMPVKPSMNLHVGKIELTGSLQPHILSHASSEIF